MVAWQEHLVRLEAAEEPCNSEGFVESSRARMADSRSERTVEFGRIVELVMIEILLELEDEDAAGDFDRVGLDLGTRRSDVKVPCCFLLPLPLTFPETACTASDLFSSG